jgi:diadenosine tetraphosphatase ApaH/serine/threonine PP2A family protein phosphatase
MRLLVLGDIHSNLEALSAVLKDARRLGFDRAVSVGDVVGYGADPSACLDLLRDLKAGIVMGNHDQAATGGLPLDTFNSYAREAVEWTAGRLSAEALAFLKALPYVIREKDYAVSHGTLHEPEEFRYLLTEAEAVASLAILDCPVCFLGHTHLPVWVRRKGEALEIAQTDAAPVKKGLPVLVNVGSVGQPRDGDPRAVYCLYDTEKEEAVLHRLDYDFEETGRKILAAGLPAILAERLRIGR